MKKLKVLVADATASVRQFIKYALEDSFPDIDIDMAPNGRNVQQRLEDTRFDLVIYDSDMPFLSGDALLEWLRKHDTLKTTPFIMMSANSDGECLKKAVHLGADAYLVKPLLREHLIAKVKEILSKNGKDSIDRRKDPRFSADGGIFIRFKPHNSRGRLVNAGMGGVLSLFDSKDAVPHILDKVVLSIEQDNKQNIEGIEGVVVRIEVIGTVARARQIQVAVKFIDEISEETKKGISALAASLNY
ncbi:MAG: response regulator [Nitrospirae bacterium]|nr:response regulator [Nitrospirota bacterium]